MTQEKETALTPQEVLRRLKLDMPQNAPKPDGQGFEENGIEGALNQLLSYDKEAVLAWIMTVPEVDFP